MKKEILVGLFVLFVLAVLAGLKPNHLATKPFAGSGPMAFGSSSAEAVIRAKSATPSTRTASLTARPEVGFQTWLDREARLINEIDPHPRQTELRLKRVAANLTVDQENELAQVVLDNTQGKGQRIFALYLLQEDPNASSDLFRPIVLLDDPVFHRPVDQGSADEMHAQFLTALALQGLQCLQDRVLRGQVSIRELQDIEAKSPIPLVANAGRSVLEAVRHGKRIALEAR